LMLLRASIIGLFSRRFNPPRQLSSKVEERERQHGRLVTRSLAVAEPRKCLSVKSGLHGLDS
jgi:hypothetical protein